MQRIAVIAGDSRPVAFYMTRDVRRRESVPPTQHHAQVGRVFPHAAEIVPIRFPVLRFTDFKADVGVIGALSGYGMLQIGRAHV